MFSTTQKPKYPALCRLPNKLWLTQCRHKISKRSRLAYRLSGSFLLLLGLLLGQNGIVFASGYTATAVIGQSNYTSGYMNGVQMTNFGLNAPTGVALDSVNHRLFVSEFQNSRVLVYDLNSSNQIVSQNASYELGEPSFSQKTCVETQSTVCQANSVVYDPVSQDLFVADAGGGRVLVYNLSSGITNGMAASYVIGQPNFTSVNGCSSSDTSICGPVAMTFDSADQLLFVTDAWDRVLVFNLARGISDGMAASYVLGQSNFAGSTDHCSGATASTFCNVNGIAFDSYDDYLFVSDGGNYRILAFNLASGISDGMAASYVLGQTSLTTGNPEEFICSDSASQLCDLSSISYDPTTQTLFAGNYQLGVDIFNLSSGISDDMDASNILGASDFGDNSCPTTVSASSNCDPTGIAYDPSSQALYVSDEVDNRVVAYDLSSGITSGMAATGLLGQTDFGGHYPNATVQPNDYGLNDPGDIAVDSVNHRLFVADAGNYRILVYSLDANDNLISTTPTYVIGQTDFNQAPQCTQNQYQMCMPYSLVYDSLDNYLIVGGESSRVMIYDLSNGITNGMNATYVLGQAAFNDEACASTQTGLCSEIDGLAFDDVNDRLFVSDDANNRVMVYDLSGGISNGMPASYVLGQTNFTNNGCGSNPYSLCDPNSLAYDATNQRLFVEDYTNGRIQVFDLSGGISNDVPASFSITGTSYTGALSYDPLSSTLILSDGLTYNVPILYIPANQASNISLVSAQIDTAGNTAACSMAPAGPNQSEFCSPGNAVYDDSSNNLFASDPLNNRILVFNFVIQSPATPPTNSVALPDTVSGFTHSVAPVDTTVTDNSKSSISKVQISLDGALTSTINSPPFNYNLPTTSVLDGTHTVSVKSFDSNGNTTTTQQTILVNNGDLNEDGTVTISDLAIMAVHWGATSSATYAEGSIMGDGAVNVSDLSVMAANWGWSAN